MKYRKLPVVIEAFQMTKERRESNVDWPQWMHKAWNLARYESGSISPRIDDSDRELVIWIDGIIIIDWDDYIICNEKGEFSLCKPDIFHATYEKVED